MQYSFTFTDDNYRELILLQAERQSNKTRVISDKTRHLTFKAHQFY